jgi:hypothetical protein
METTPEAESPFASNDNPPILSPTSSHFHMKPILYTILFSTCLFLFSCDLEMSGDGTYDGNWQLRTMENLATGEKTDMSHSYIYWGIEGNLLQVRDIDNKDYQDSRGLIIFFSLTRKDHHFLLREPYHSITKDHLEPIEDITMLMPLGINGTTEDFLVETHTSSTLVLKSETVRMRFRKY